MGKNKKSPKRRLRALKDFLLNVLAGVIAGILTEILFRILGF